ncbi:hypothetical protein AND_009992 [Anopheles darlingi]|uniref:Uncharacterized protein n=1 Tax=Anopheles darlingi TaxID=43151 RepID=W5J3L2_ANODA|nr:hypothetical protein AND_009992 [Anopheles darlingi]
MHLLHTGRTGVHKTTTTTTTTTTTVASVLASNVPVAVCSMAKGREGSFIHQFAAGPPPQGKNVGGFFIHKLFSCTANATRQSPTTPHETDNGDDDDDIGDLCDAASSRELHAMHHDADDGPFKCKWKLLLLLLLPSGNFGGLALPRLDEKEDGWKRPDGPAVVAGTVERTPNVLDGDDDDDSHRRRRRRIVLIGSDFDVFAPFMYGTMIINHSNSSSSNSNSSISSYE